MPSKLTFVLFLAAMSGAALAPAAEMPAMFRGDPAHTAAQPGSTPALVGLKWWFTTGGPVRSTAAVAGGLAVFGSNDGFLYALDVATGAEKWRVKLGGDVSGSPAIVDGRVVVMAPDGRLCAFRLADGGAIWTLKTGADLSLGPDPRAFDLWVSSPTVVDDTVYVGGGDGRAYAVELATGRLRWSFATQSRVRSTPAVDRGTVFVGSFDGRVYALDAASGAERWRFATGDVVQSSPAVAGDTVVVGSRAMAVYGLDAKTGALRWRRPHSGSWILGSAAVAGGAVVIGGSDSHRLEALDAATGAPIWSSDVGGRVLGSPAVVGGAVIYGGEDFRVYTIDLATGLGRSSDFTEGAIYSSVAVADGLALVGSEDRRLYAFALRPDTAAADSAPPDLMMAAEGRYRTAEGDEYVVARHMGRLGVAYCTYPPALFALQADGSFACPMLWGMTGRLKREPGRPAAALVISQFGREIIADRVNVSP